MKSPQIIVIQDRVYTIDLERFDEEIDLESGADYHGYHITISSNDIVVTARHYDNEDVMSIQQGLHVNEKQLVADMKSIALELFHATKLKLLDESNSGLGYRLIESQ